MADGLSGDHTGAGNALLFTLEQRCVPTLGGKMFPVRRVYCIGRNYADHAKEMGSDPKLEPPFFFQKPADAVQYVAAGSVGENPYPPHTENYHYELELVVFLKSGGRDIPTAKALECIYGYAIGLDMTRRDRQQDMKNGRKPWEIGKSFDCSAPIGPIVPAAQLEHPDKGLIRLTVNGTVKQQADLSDMIWSVPEQIAKLSSMDQLCAGDIILSGTPAGVGPVVRGDMLVGTIEGLPDLQMRIV